MIIVIIIPLGSFIVIVIVMPAALRPGSHSNVYPLPTSPRVLLFSTLFNDYYYCAGLSWCVWIRQFYCQTARLIYATNNRDNYISDCLLSLFLSSFFPLSSVPSSVRVVRSFSLFCFLNVSLIIKQGAVSTQCRCKYLNVFNILY